MWGLAVAVFLLYDRLPLGERARQAACAAAAAAGACGRPRRRRRADHRQPDGMGARRLCRAVGLLTFDFAGSSPTQASGLFEEKEFRVALDLERCSGAYNLLGGLSGGRASRSGRRFTRWRSSHADRCIRCGACVVQCPQDALAFEAPEGRRVEPEHVRRYKLNLLGRRAVRLAAAAGAAGDTVEPD